MNDAPCMGSVKTVGDFDGERQEHVRLHGPPGNEVLESLTFKKLHGDEGLAGRLADLIDGADAGVIQCGSSLRFSLKTRQSVRIMRRLLRQKLQRDEAMQREVFGLVDNPHSAAAQLLDNAVMRDTLADHCRESYVGTMAGVSFCLLFLVSASKLKPVGSDVALVIAYALDVLGSAPFGELATRALLYAWLFVGIPAGVSAVVNLILAPSPLKILLRELALRLRTAGQALQGDTEAISQVRKLTAEGDAELQFQLKLSVIEHSSKRADLDALQGATDCVVAVLSAVQLMVSERDALPSRATREQMTHKLFELAQIFERNAYPAQVEPISNKEEESDLARSGIGLFNVGLKHFGKITPAELPRKKEKSGFLATDAFTNPEHVDFALKTTAAAMLCYLIYTLLGWPGIHTAFITCYIVSLGTVGETVQKLTLRILGCLVGVGLGLFVMIGIIPRVTGIGHLALIVFGGVFIAAWVAVGSPQISYAGFQMAFAFLLCVVQGLSLIHI